jgi:23S rRNA U2552 (ribose-2'-O)-methylase RlmE/FtsJ
MNTKHFKLDSTDGSDGSDGLLDVELRLNATLTMQKNRITQYQKQWEKYKKLANPYELVFTSRHCMDSFALKNPVSRAYFKHWEIMHDFPKIIKSDVNTPFKCLFLAEGPGGFIQSMYDKRENICEDDEYYGITLLSSEKSIPPWKLPEHVRQDDKVHLLKGVDGTGSLYNEQNLVSFANTIGRKTCDYVTGDGGFDCSDDYNMQEEASLILIIAEIYLALCMLKQNGVFLLKVFNLGSTNSKKLIQILRDNFQEIIITKPYTSRPANSEKYILCINYLGLAKNSDVLLKCITDHNHDALDLVQMNPEIARQIAKINSIFITWQIEQISTTMHAITRGTDVGMTARHQVQIAQDWCEEYKMSHK